MKKLLTLTLLVGFLFIGCQDDNSVLEPNNKSNIEALGKIITEGPENEVIHTYNCVLPK